MNWFMSVMKRPLEFSGRARREEYWHFLGFSILFTVILSVLDGVLGLYSTSEDIGVLNGIFSLLILIPSLAVTARRLHDTDRSGWWMLLYFIPVLGFLVLLYFMVLDSDSGSNRFGNNPKA